MSVKQNEKDHLLNNLFDINTNIKLVTSEHLDFIVESLIGERIVSLDFQGVEEILKLKYITYSSLDFNKESTKEFTDLIKSKFSNQNLILIFVFNNEDDCLTNMNNYEEELDKLKYVNKFISGMMVKNITKSKIYILGATDKIKRD